ERVVFELGLRYHSGMKSNALKTRKATAPRKQKKSSNLSTAEMKTKIKPSFGQQVEAFIERYRPALEALAKR
ncbi:MAG: hypothetical protein ACT4OO_01815, partial [Nitrospiraceae bacterium]